MRKKIFTFLLALVASVGMSWASVTWISDQYGNEKGYNAGTPFTKDGVTVTMSDNAFFNVSYWGDASLQCINGTFDPTAGNYVFSNSLGENFVKIIIAAGYPSEWEWFPKGDGWVLSGDEYNGYILTWTGNASTVTLMDNELHSVHQSIEGDIVFMFESDSEEPEPAGNVKLIEFQVPASWENDNTPISIADFPDFVATTYEIASALPVTSEPSLVVFDFPGDDEVSVYSKMGGQVSKASTGAIKREAFFENTQVHYYYPVLEGGEPTPQPQIGPKEVLDLGTTGCVGEHYQLTGGGTNIYRTVGGVDDKMITIESLHGEIIDNISLKLYYYNVWTGYSVAASSGDVSSWNYDAYDDLVITNINATSVTLSRVGSGQENGYVMFEKVTINNSDEPQPEPQPEGDGKLAGAFTINADGDQIVFSKGNLQYQASTTTWQFATNQYDMIGADNANISDTYTGWIDLFGWGTGNCPTKKSTDDEDYSTFTDWGVNAISNGGNEANLWRTLTRYEWAYLIQTRTNAADLKGQATVADVHGFVLLPDSWTLPAGLSFTAIPNDWTTNVYTAEQWAQMEAAGAVFLPATGYRNPDIVYVGEKGWYWSSDVLTDLAAYDFEFTETNSRVFGSRHYFGQPVRLVTAYDAPTPQPAEDVDITPNVDPDHAGVYYSTFFDSANKYALPAGVEAYVATRDGANLLLSKIADAGQTIPANNAVILKSSVDQFTLTVSDAEAVTFTATNDLQGTDVSIATPDNCYVLAGNDGVGFYHYTASMLNPHKAYVIYSGSNQAPHRMPFVFNQATGVDQVPSDQVQSTKILENGVLYIIKNGVKYNAQGQVVK